VSRSPELAEQAVLVTGATGFVGARLTRELASLGAAVHALVRPGTPPAAVPGGATAHEADLLDPAAVEAALRAAAPRVVFHLAAPGGHGLDPEERRALVAGTVAGTANLLEALRPLPFERLVHVGSSLEYGPKAGPTAETDALEPITVRGAAKAAAALLALQLAREGRPVTVVRPFSVYGPGEPPHRLVPTVARAALRGETIRLTRPGIRRDFVFVDDVVEALVLAASSPAVAGETFNVGTGRETANEEVVATLADVLGLELDVEVGAFDAYPWDTGTWEADNRKARRLLGWEPRHGLADGLRATVEWARAGAGRREAAVAP
jgi:nucleoside-diphosphate-sugar epimerase